MMFLEKLRVDAWRTAGARYNAAYRLKRRDSFANPSIALFAAVGLGLTLFEKVYEVRDGTVLDKYLTIVSLALGLFVIIISLVEWGSSGPQKAEALYRNAEELNAFQRKVARLIAQHRDGEIVNLNLEELSEEYRRTKDGCPHNHEPLDDNRFVARHRLSPEFCDEKGIPRMNWGEAQIARINSFLDPIWYYCILWCALGALLFVMPLDEIRNAAKSDSKHAGELGSAGEQRSKTK